MLEGDEGPRVTGLSCMDDLKGLHLEQTVQAEWLGECILSRSG